MRNDNYEDYQSHNSDHDDHDDPCNDKNEYYESHNHDHDDPCNDEYEEYPDQNDELHGHMLVREAVLYQIGCFLTHCVRGGRGSNPCVKIYVVDLYKSGGLLTT